MRPPVATSEHSGGTSFDALVLRVIRAQRVVELQPRVRDVLGVDVAERAIAFLVVQLFVQREERIVEDARLAGRLERGVRHE